METTFSDIEQRLVTHALAGRAVEE